LILQLSGDSAFLRGLWMDVKGEVLLQLFNRIKLRNGTKTYIVQILFSIYSQI